MSSSVLFSSTHSVVEVCILYIHPSQEDTVVAAEGIDKLGKGVLLVSFTPVTNTALDGLGLQEDASMESDIQRRIPVDALEVVGIRCSDEVLGTWLV